MAVLVIFQYFINFRGPETKNKSKLEKMTSNVYDTYLEDASK